MIKPIKALMAQNHITGSKVFNPQKAYASNFASKGTKLNVTTECIQTPPATGRKINYYI